MRVEVDRISKRFGGLQALDAVSLEVGAGEVTAVIGPNGAGKSTLLGCLSGMIPIDSGRVLIEGVETTLRSPARLVQLGITRTFQNIRLFEGLSALEHLELARHSARRTHRSAAQPDSMALLARVGLEAKAHLRPASLSYGERRRLEIARGLATRPSLFLIDEPAAGSTLSEQRDLADLIKAIADEGVAVILVEHHMDLVARASARVVVLNFGRVLLTGPIEAVRRDPAVIAAYLGTAA